MFRTQHLHNAYLPLTFLHFSYYLKNYKTEILIKDVFFILTLILSKYIGDFFWKNTDRDNTCFRKKRYFIVHDLQS